MEIEFNGPIIEWRGPAPFYFVALPPEVCDELNTVASEASYGWGCIPVDVSLEVSPCGATKHSPSFYTALIPREGGYLLPLKVAARKASGLGETGEVFGTLSLRV